MADDSTISGLSPLAANPADTDLFVIVDVSDTTMDATGTNKKLAASYVSFRTNTETLTNKTLTAPAISDFSAANHSHQNSAGGGQLDHGAALTGLGDDDHTQYLLATGSRTGASSQAQTFTNGIIGPTWKPASDSTTAMQITPSAGGTFWTFDTTNRRVYADDGNTPAAAILPGDAFNISASGANAISATIVASNTATQRGIFRGVRARGTVASPSAVAAGDTVFSFLSAGYDGAALQSTALIEFLVDSGTVSSGVLPQKIIFVTGDTNSASRTERLVVKSNGFVGIGLGTGGTPTGRLHIGGAASASAWGTAGIEFQAAAATFTDSSTAASGTATNAVANSFGRPTFAATNATVTMTNAATVYIANSPAAGTNVTLTNAYALWVDDGSARFDGNIGFFAKAPAAQQTSGADLTNNVTSGGTTDTIANYTDLSVYANDSAAIRNNIYQLARKVKQVNDALRLYGLLT